MNPQYKENIQVGQEVDVVLKKDQKTNTLTNGIIKRILTNSSHHPYGIKVELESGKVGRVKKIKN